MTRHKRLWASLFEPEPPLRYELLLVYLLVVKVIKESLSHLLQSGAAFYSEDVFKPFVVGVHPVGWAHWLPPALVMSHRFNQALAATAVLGAACWLLKRWLPWSALVTVASYGLLNSLLLTRVFDYIHQNLPAVAVLIAFAALYVFRRREIGRALRERRFWGSMVYRRWVYGLILVYMGLFYTYSGVVKLINGGWEAGDGVKLQLILDRFGPGSAWALPVVRFRPLATFLMTSTVILEVGSLPALLVRRLRPWWAMGLVMMHVMIILTLQIRFTASMVILGWLAFPVDRWFLWSRGVLVGLVRGRRGGRVVTPATLGSPAASGRGPEPSHPTGERLT